MLNDATQLIFFWGSIAYRHISDWYLLTGNQDLIGGRDEGAYLELYFGDESVGTGRNLEEGFMFQHHLFVYSLLLLHNNACLLNVVLINYYGSDGETDLQCGTHFANNHIIIAEIVKSWKDIGCISSYVKYYLIYQVALHKVILRCNFNSPYE